jgi:hypothetical protein
LGIGSSGLRSMMRIFSCYESVAALRGTNMLKTYRNFVERLVPKRVMYLVLPVTFYPCEDVLFGHVLDLRGGVILCVVFEDHALDLVLCPSEPAFLEVLEDDLQARLRAGDVARVGNGDAEGSCPVSVHRFSYWPLVPTSQKTTQVRCRVGQLVLLVIPVLERDEDAQVVCSRHDTHASPSELCAQLIVAPCADTLLGAVHVEGGDGRVV